jgi:membrane-associated phospholipid phosphatase
VRYASAFLLSAVFATLAVLVATGALTGVDQWSIDHLMPGGTFNGEDSRLLTAIVPLYDVHWNNAWDIASNIVTLPAAFVVSLAVVAWRSRALAVLLVVATAVETLCKHVLDRPALYDGAKHITGFDSSFPSGHTLRTVILAAAFASPWSAAWAIVSITLLQLAGWHTPSDIAGGIVLGLLALLGARGAAGALRARGLLRGRAARR